MYERIHAMLHDYHQFESRPSFLEMRDVIKAMQNGTLLLAQSGIQRPSCKAVVNELNSQWLSMSNTYPMCILANEAPVTEYGYMFNNGTFKQTKPSDSIIIAGYRPLLANLMVFNGAKTLQYVYFSVKQNKFVRSIHPLVGLIPIKDIFNRPSNVHLYSDLPAKNAIESKRHDAALRKVADEVLDKWSLFVFPICFCHHLTKEQQTGWCESLIKNWRKDAFRHVD